MKICTNCKQEKDESEFYKGKGYKDGLRSECKKCCNTRSVKWSRKNKSRSKEFATRWRKNNPDKARLSAKKSYCKYREKYNLKAKEYKRQHKEYYIQKQKESYKKWYKNNLEKVKERKRLYYQEHEEECKLSCKQYYNQNKEYLKYKRKEWRKNNQDKTREIGRRYRAKKKGTGGSVSNIEWKELCSHYGNICLRCGSSDKLTQDHVVPLSKGGFHTIYNLQPLCRSCNSSKRDKTIDYRPDVISNFV